MVDEDNGLLFDLTGESDGYAPALPMLRSAVAALKAEDWTPSVELARRLTHAAALALQEDGSVRRALDVRDTVEYARQLFKNRGARLAETNVLCHQRVHTEHELGRRLPREIQHGGDRRSSLKDSSLKLADLGLDYRQSHEFQRLARHDWADYDTIFREELAKADGGQEISTAEALRICRSFCRPGEPTWPEAPPGVFDIVYADPPWQYDFAQAPESGLLSSGRSIEQQYPTASVEELCAMPLPAVAEDAMLFLWATSPKLAEALRVLEAWGFTYRTNMVWVKDRIGMGYYARQRHELLLIAKRGDYPAPAEHTRPDSVLEAPRGEHSAKPREVYGLLQSMYPEGRFLELFSRGDVPAGWTGWGNEHDAA